MFWAVVKHSQITGVRWDCEGMTSKWRMMFRGGPRNEIDPIKIVQFLKWSRPLKLIDHFRHLFQNHKTDPIYSAINSSVHFRTGMRKVSVSSIAVASVVPLFANNSLFIPLSQQYWQLMLFIRRWTMRAITENWPDVKYRAIFLLAPFNFFTRTNSECKSTIRAINHSQRSRCLVPTSIHF